MPSPGITDARASFDGLYAGSFLAAAFCGFTSHQTYVYFKQSTGDPSWMRHTVFTLWIGDVMHAVLGAISAHQVAIEFIEDPSGLLQDTVPWTLSASFFLMVITDTTVKRIWRRMALVAPTVLPVLCALVAGLYAAVRTTGKPDIIAIDLLAQIEVTLTSALISDVQLAGIQATSLISLLVLYVVTTGVLTSVVAIATLAIMLRMRHSFAYDGAFYMLSRMYFSSLLATLNRREDFRGWKRPPEPSKDIEVFPLQATGRGRVEFGPETLEQHSGRPLNTSGRTGKPDIIAIDLLAQIEVTLTSALISDVQLAGIQATSLISLLVLYVVTTGVLTSVVAIATLAIMLRMRHSFAYDGAFYMLSRMYFSSLLATLNRREDFRGWKRPPEPSKDIEVFPLQATGRGRVEFGPETLEQHSGRPLNTSAHMNPPPIQIDIMVERSISLDTHRRDPPHVGPSGPKTQLSFESYQDTEMSNAYN
ncbi:uncharacterized protein STEHIDRAFT_157766 [Stereum hirsutum FP-91666 SS1]|uniref:uncharacterized protein n=1 Tax=Stereum hirsutum (strain FP-91666) TaxID=721885 RepID=UPI0004449799|nr:uncharacterized protein STEHIDRAFT_157766 [Stereum hirsutum FP-91666 SS1]EIM86265.1 hypothetical protein STEHIDRAFT_157766 [Stereum hirsutum FP-91666 SS1]